MFLEHAILQGVRLSSAQRAFKNDIQEKRYLWHTKHHNGTTAKRQIFISSDWYHM